MPLQIIQQDITKLRVDAIVNSTNEDYYPSGAIDSAVHLAAGNELYEACKKLPQCQTGSVQVTDAYNLPCKYVIHTVCPYYDQSGEDEELLQSCYTEALYVAQEKKCKSVAFPALGIGGKGFPSNHAMNLAILAIKEYLDVKDDINVYIVVFQKELYNIIQTLYPKYCASNSVVDYSADASLEDKLNHIDVKFFDLLMHYARERGVTTSECYKNACVDKRLFSKIKNNSNYLPSKMTIIQFAFSLKLTLDKTQKLLRTCGYVLSESIAEDIIVMHYISQRQFDIDNLKERLDKERSL